MDVTQINKWTVQGVRLTLGFLNVCIIYFMLTIDSYLFILLRFQRVFVKSTNF
jgi:hypothetical protein